MRHKHQPPVTLICKYCKNTFYRKAGVHRHELKRGKQKVFCSKKCREKIIYRKTITFNCELCGQKKTCNLSDYKKVKNHFCSHKCANKWLIDTGQCRQPEGKCKLCNQALSSSRTYCNKCWSEKRDKVRMSISNKRQCVDCKDASFGGYIRCESCQNIFENTAKICDFVYKDSNRYSYIRKHAAKIIDKNNIKRECINCFFSLFTEICHIKPISDFPPNTLLKDVNNIDNLAILCPNCHVCFDRIPEEREKILNKIKSGGGASIPHDGI